MFTYISRRVIYSIVVVICVLFAVFVVARLSPIDPVKYILRQNSQVKGVINPAEYAAMRHQLGLDRPILVQFVAYITGVMRGDFGMSIINPGRKVSDILSSGIPVSLHLALMGLSLQFILGNLLGILAAVRQNSLFDRLGMGVAIIANAVPELVWGVIFIVIFAMELRWLPIRGWGTPKFWVLPTLTIAISGIGAYARFGRAAVLDQMRQDYVRTARAKGLREIQVLFRHILKNALVPIVTFVGPSFAFLITGDFIVETMFGIPGIAFYTVNASIHGDYPVIQATVLLITVMIMTVNLCVDLLYGVIDPRIRLD